MELTIDDVKTRYRVEDIAEKYTQLKKIGSNLRGKCPLHEERTPSFYVYTGTNTWFCYGCQQGGDVINLIQSINNCPFPSALQILTNNANVLPARPQILTPKQKEWMQSAIIISQRYRRVGNILTQYRQSPAEKYVQQIKTEITILLKEVAKLESFKGTIPNVRGMDIASLLLSPDVEPFIYGSSEYRRILLEIMVESLPRNKK
jgi:DNA primase